MVNKPLIWKCYFPVPAALVVPIWRPKISYLGALPNMVGRAGQQGRPGQEGQRAVFPCVRGRGGQGRAGQPPDPPGRAGQGNGSRPWGVPPQTPNTDQKHANGSGFGVLIITD